MNTTRTILSALCIASATTVAYAQSYPTRPVRVVVGAAAGGGTDILARLLAPRMSEALGQNVIIDNRPGAGTNIGAEIVAHATPDGYSVLIGSTPHAINASLYSKLPFDPITSFTPISVLATVQTALVVHPSVPAKNVSELIALAKTKRGAITAASSAGTSQFLAVELFKTMAGLDIVSVPYKGAGPAMNDVIGGQVQMQVNTLLATLPHIQAGRLRILGVCGRSRSRLLPDVPTIGETLKSFESNGWYAMFAPARTPADVIARLNDVTVKSLRTRDIEDKLLAQGVDVVASTPGELASYLKVEIPKWAKVVKAAGLTAQ
jgi:tripartite-type tricarboxylate transporter receptor subunit TctC